MSTRRKQGQKYDNGYAKNQILLVLCEHPKGVEEPQIRDIIKERLGISEPKGLHDHLTDLKKEGLLFEEKRSGKATIWFLKPEGFLMLVNKFLNTSDGFTFHTSAYCQGMVNQELVKKIKDIWLTEIEKNTEDIPAQETTLTEKERKNKIQQYNELMKDYNKLAKTPLRELDSICEGLDNPHTPEEKKAERATIFQRSIRDEDLEWILKLSPSALKTALNPDLTKAQSNISFMSFMFVELMSDMMNNRCPKSYGTINLFVDMNTKLIINGNYKIDGTTGNMNLVA